MKTRLTYLVSFCCVAFACRASLAAGPLGTVSVQEGNIVYTDPTGATEVLTETGADGAPRLSPDGTLVAFTRLTRDADEANFNPAVRDLWVIRLKDHKARRLVTGAPEGKEQPEQVLAAIDHPAFSPDDDTVYFMTAAWATSSAIHAVSAAGGAQRFVTSGNSLEVVSVGRYKGALLVEQHRYMDGHGSWNPAVLVSSSGKKIKVVGEGRHALQSVEAEQ